MPVFLPSKFFYLFITYIEATPSSTLSLSGKFPSVLLIEAEGTVRLGAGLADAGYTSLPKYRRANSYPACVGAAAAAYSQ